jgi:predicted Zn-dependent peptidase
MSHHARQEIYRDPLDSLDSMLAAIERVSVEDVQRLAGELFTEESLAATVLGNVNGLELEREHFSLD